MSEKDVVYSQQLMYCCMDGGCVRVDPRCIYESELVEWDIKENEWAQEQDPDPSEMDAWENWMLDGTLGRFPSDVHVSRRILDLVEMFCLERFEIFREYYDANDDDITRALLLDKVLEFDSLFVQDKSLTLLVRLMDAAFELNINSLFDLTCNAIVEKIDGMSAKQILKIFNLPDFTHRVWKQSILPEPWDPMELDF